MNKSEGTKTWIEECNRLLDRCIKQVGSGAHAEVRQAFEFIFELLERINHGEDDVIFFADEGGEWQVGVDWPAVLPAWFACLAATADPDEYAMAVVRVVDEFERHAREKHLKKARALASPAQRRALRTFSVG